MVSLQLQCNNGNISYGITCSGGTTKARHANISHAFLTPSLVWRAEFIFFSFWSSSTRQNLQYFVAQTEVNMGQEKSLWWFITVCSPADLCLSASCSLSFRPGMTNCTVYYVSWCRKHKNFGSSSKGMSFQRSWGGNNNKYLTEV